MTEPQAVGRVKHLHPADRVAAWVTGIGVGLLAFMITWLVAARVTEQIWDHPRAAYTAMGIALIVGLVAAVLAGRRLLHRTTSRAVGADATTQDGHHGTAAITRPASV